MVLATIPSLAQEGIDQISILRWCGWVLLLVAVGPLFEVGYSYRAQLWATLGWLSVTISVASLFVWIVGIQLSGRGIFYGIMTHSMVLAPIAGLSLIESLNRYLRTGNRLWIVAIGAAMINLLLCASRGSIVGTSLGVIWMIMTVGGVRRQASIFAVSVLGAIMVIVDLGFFSVASSQTSPNQEGPVLTEVLRVKSFSNTRAWLWEARIAEFRESPAIGIGFLRTIYGRESELGEIEPGSSYLAILSMTGLVGAFGWLASPAVGWSA